MSRPKRVIFVIVIILLYCEVAAWSLHAWSRSHLFRYVPQRLIDDRPRCRHVPARCHCSRTGVRPTRRHARRRVRHTIAIIIIICRRGDRNESRRSPRRCRPGRTTISGARRTPKPTTAGQVASLRIADKTPKPNELRVNGHDAARVYRDSRSATTDSNNILVFIEFEYFIITQS